MRNTTNETSLAVQIVEFVDEHEPGIVACVFTDAAGVERRFIDKVPIFTLEYLDAASPYPQEGAVRCTVLREWRDESGKKLVQVSTSIPDDVQDTNGVSEFVVLATQLLSQI